MDKGVAVLNRLLRALWNAFAILCMFLALCAAVAAVAVVVYVFAYGVGHLVSTVIVARW